jgi:large subunit ribosomal protein L5
VIPRLLTKYKEEAIPKMKEKFGIKNSMAVPKLEKVVINMGVGKAITDAKALESAVNDLTTITGQKPIITKARVAISNFKLKEGVSIGCKVTLRGAKMYEFLDKLFNVVLPRIRDFNGVSRKSFDKQGNYCMGLPEQSMFPEIDTGRILYPQGMDIIVVFNKGPKEHTLELLNILGMVFTKR